MPIIVKTADTIFDLKIPSKIRTIIKMIKVLCFVKKNKNKYTNVQLGQMFDLANTTIGRLLEKKLKNHKEMFKFIEQYPDTCKKKSDEELILYVLAYFILPKFSPSTIFKINFFNKIYPLALELNNELKIKKEKFLEIKKIYNKRSYEKNKKSKRDKIENLKIFLENYKSQSQSVNLNKKIKKDKKNINILATNYSS